MAVTIALLAAGAGLAYFLDARSGGRRRALLRDKAVHAAHKARTAAAEVRHDARHRLKGIVWEGKGRLWGDGADDDILLERVPARLGRVVRHPGSIEVEVREGRVILTGPVLTDEVEDLLKKIHSVKGVRDVESKLKVYEEPGDVPGLQGGLPRQREKPGPAQENWPPALRLLAGAGGAGLLLYGRRRGRLAGAAAELGGAALLARALSGLPFRELVGLKAGRDVIEIHKTLHVRAPIDRVFAVWCNYENFPKFMSHVRKVVETDVETGIARWTVDGPGGVPVEFDAFLTEIVHNQVLAWKTLEGSFIQHEGRVRFFPDTAGGTRVDVHMSYNPGLGAVGHGLAKMLGADPKRRMDEDLARMKTFIEEEKRSRDAAEKKTQGL